MEEKEAELVRYKCSECGAIFFGETVEEGEMKPNWCGCEVKDSIHKIFEG